MIFHFELPESKRVGGLNQAVYDVVRALNAHTRQTHARLGRHFPNNLKGVQAVHFHGIWDAQHLQFAQRCREHLIPYLVSPHGMLEPWSLKHKWLKKRIHRSLFTDSYLRQAQALIATSDLEARHLQQLYPDATVHTLPLGIVPRKQVDPREARRRLGMDPDHFVIVYLSRIDAKKNLERLLKAALELPALQRQKLSIAVVGTGAGPYFRRCQAAANRCRENGITIHWMGPVWDDGKWDWLAAADLLALPSESENFGYVYLESLAMGTPILTTPHTPWGDRPDPTCTEVCEPTTESIASAIARAIEHFSGYSEREQVATRYQSEYQWETLALRYAPIYPMPPQGTFTHAPF